MDHAAAGLWVEHVLLEIGRKPASRPRGAGVGGDVRGVGLVFVEQRDRPGAAFGDGDRFDVGGADDAGGEAFVLEQVAGHHALDRDQDALGGVREGGEFAPPADPDIAGFVGHDGMEGGDVGREGGEQDDLVRLGAERVLDDLPVRPMREEVAAQDAAQRHEGNALLRRLQHGVDGGAGRVEHAQAAAGDGGGEAGGKPGLAEADGAGLRPRRRTRPRSAGR